MVNQPGFHNRQRHLASKIRSLLISVAKEPSEYDNITPKIEYWIEYSLRERFATVDELVEEVSYVAWDQYGSHTIVVRFLKEFYDAPRRSEQARLFVGTLCEHVLRWFATAAAEDTYYGNSSSVASGGGPGFLHAALFIGHLIELGLLNRDLVRQHLVKPLISHHGYNQYRHGAIYILFLVAGNTLLRGLLKPEDVRVCFETLDTQMSFGGVEGPNSMQLQVGCAACSGISPGINSFGQEFREVHAAWLEQREGSQSDAEGAGMGGGEATGGAVVAEGTVEIETPIAFVPQDLPPTETDSGTISSILRGDPWSSSETFANIQTTAVSSPTFTISTVSDLTPTELGEETEHSAERVTRNHDTFYFEDGNVEIVCGDTVFRVHSTVISFSSPKLRDILSPTALLTAPTPNGCPRTVLADSADDFAVLLRVIYTPGYVTHPLNVGPAD